MSEPRRLSETAANSAFKLLIGAAIGGILATGMATIADSANAQAIASNATAIMSNAGADAAFRQQVRTDLAVIGDRQIRVQSDVAEIKEILRERER